MNWNYIRGMFDGDGCAYTLLGNNRNSYGILMFVSKDKDFLGKIKHFIDNELNITGGFNLNRTTMVWRLLYRRKKDVIKLGLKLASGYLCKRSAVLERVYLNGYIEDVSPVRRDINLEYICGFFDADGSVFLSGRGNVRVAFANKNLALLSDIRDFFGMDTKIYIMKHNRLPDYQLATEKKSKILPILEALKSNSVKKYDEIVEGIYWLNKIYGKTSRIWTDSDMKILRNNIQLDVWRLSEILDRKPSLIHYRKMLVIS